VRVADQRNVALTVVAVSSAVVACCALAVTIKVMNAVPVQRVMDPKTLERLVADEADVETEDVACPASVVVEVGKKFECNVGEFWVVSDQGEISSFEP
jgi:hypothetical protein